MDKMLLNNTLTITNQPKQNFHYRYVTELRNTHGVIIGQQQLQSQKPIQYPTINLQLPTNADLDEAGNKRTFFVLCSLHCYKDGPKVLSPHLLMEKGVTVVTHKFIFDQMEDSPADVLQRTWSLKDYVIVRLRKQDYQKSLQEKQKKFEDLDLPLNFETLKGNLNIEDTKSRDESGLLNVCLGFTIFEKDLLTNTYRLYKETVYSDNIFHGDDLKIHYLCNAKGSVNGGTTVTILISLPSGYEYEVHMFRFKSNSSVIDWEEYIPITDKDIFRNAAVTFKLPKGPSDDNNDEIYVMLEVTVNRSTFKSQPVRFSFLNQIEDSLPRKRPHRQDNVATVTGLENPPQISENIEYSASSSIIYPTVPLSPSIDNFDYMFDEFISFDNMFPCINSADIHLPKTDAANSEEPYISKDKAVSGDADKSQICNTFYGKTFHSKQNVHINSVFHDIIMDPTRRKLLSLYKYTKDVTHNSQVILNARNSYRHNLLHYACLRNKPACIRPLIGMGVSLCQQDLQGRTPLHIAIEHRHAECIFIIQDILRDPSEYSNDIRDQLIRMFKVYNNEGHTILHAATLAKLPDLVRVMLVFCKQHNVNVLEYEILGNGDSIVHIMVKENLLDMIKVVKEHLRFYLLIRNYRGQTVLDIPDLSLEMFQALKS